MMVAAYVPDRASESLAELLSRQVRSLSGRVIAADIAAGALALAAALIWRPFAWFSFALAGFCAVAMGLWAMADAELTDDGAMPRLTRVVLRGVCGLTAVAGTLAALMLAFSVVAVFIGTWRS